VNPVDTYIRGGLHSVKPALPYTPGADAAGVVEEVGDGVVHVKRGDRVYLAGSRTGTYAERAVASAAQVHPLPERVTFAQGAALGVPYATAWRALFQVARVEAGETVLVHGASGSVGMAAVQLARAAGATVLGTAGTDEGRARVAAQGAHHVFGHDDDAVSRLTGGRGADVILEMRADLNLARDTTLVAKRGRICVIGSRGTITIDPRALMTRDASVTGMMLFNATPEELRRIHAGLAAALEGGVARPVIAREMPLADAARAHVAVLEPGTAGKIVLVPGAGS
jgi:NADPH2:quinone reductase